MVVRDQRTRILAFDWFPNPCCPQLKADNMTFKKEEELRTELLQGTAPISGKKRTLTRNGPFIRFGAKIKAFLFLVEHHISFSDIIS